MGTSLNCSAWSTTAASNSGADSTIGTVADTSPPTSVDDWTRSIMAAVKKYVLDTDGGLTAGGTADALTLSTNRGIDSGHQAAGFSLRFKASATNTGAATLAVDGLTAVSLKGSDGADLSAGQIVDGGIYDVAFDGTNYKLLGASAPTTRAGLGLATSDSPQFAGINLGHESDTTLTRASAGRIAVEGVTIEPGATRASVSAYKSGNQTMSATGPTKVTFNTEAFDVGSKFASSTWTPPAGTCRITAAIGASSIASASDGLLFYIYKNGSPFRMTGIKSSNISALGVDLAAAVISVIDQCSGSDTYEVYAATVSDSSWTILASLAGAVTTYFMGEMV